MAADDFFSRWSKRKTGAAEPPAGQAPVEGAGMREAAQPAALPAQSAEPAPPPTLEDVEKLTLDSDYSRFVARDVDENVKRSALKKLFSIPQFNVMDGLDIYIDDYTKFAPISPEMLASLNHAKDLLDPLRNLQKPMMRMLENPAVSELPPTADEPEQETAEQGMDNNDAQLLQQQEDELPAESQSDALGEPPADKKASAEADAERSAGDDNQHLSQNSQ